MLIKKNIIKKISLLLLSLSLCIVPINAFAYDSELTNVIDESEDVITFENYATNKDKQYVNLRNNLIDMYGAEKAYSMLGFAPVEEKLIPLDENNNSTKLPKSDSIISPTAVDPVISSKPKTESVTNKGYMKITIYKNLTSNYMDLWYEMVYTDDTSGVGGKTYGDALASSFSISNVYKVSTSYSGVIQNYTPYSYGGTGTIRGGSNYARMIFTVKPRSGSVSSISEETNMVLGRRTTNISDNFAFSAQLGYIGISITGAGITNHSLSLTY